MIPTNDITILLGLKHQEYEPAGGTGAGVYLNGEDALTMKLIK